MQWFDPISGEWLNRMSVMANESGEIEVATFPAGSALVERDWALKVKRQ